MAQWLASSANREVCGSSLTVSTDDPRIILSSILDVAAQWTLTNLCILHNIFTKIPMRLVSDKNSDIVNHDEY